jgi:general secretion pathway protein K
LAYGPADGDFQTPQDAFRLLGLDFATARRLRPLVTVYSRAGTINPMFAPLGALASLPGISGETVSQIIALRDVASSDVLRGYLQPFQQFLDDSEGPVYSIEVTVERSGVRAAPVEVTVLLSRSTKAPYRVLGIETLPAAAPTGKQ